MGEHAGELCPGTKGLEGPVIHSDDPECGERRSLNPVHQLKRALKSADLSQIDSLTLLDHQNAPLGIECCLQVGVSREAEQLAQKIIDRFSGDKSPAKLRTKNLASGKCAASCAIQQARFPTAARSHKDTGREPACVPVAESLFQAGKFPVPAYQKPPIFNGCEPEE